MGGRDGLGVATAGAGIVSLAVDVAVLAGGIRYSQGVTTAGTLGMTEVAVLLTLTVLAVRRSRVGVAVGAGILAGLAVPLWLLRFGPPEQSAESAGGYAAWGTLAVLAVVVGLYLRGLDQRRIREVAAARRLQRLELADDLHDFVVHDVNEMLLQAQAGQVLLSGRTGGDGAAPASVGDVLRRIEQTALRALETVDRTVQLLHDDVDEAGRSGGPAGSDMDNASRSPQPTVDQLPELVHRFTATGPVKAELDLTPDLASAVGAAPSLPPEVSTTVYRIVVEALTNIRRHAAGARLVRVTVAAGPGDRVRVEVTNDDGPGHNVARRTGAGHGTGRWGRPRSGDAFRLGDAKHIESRHSGLGLAGLAARVGALGGTLNAGPAEPTGWRVSAVLPTPARRVAADPGAL